MASERLDLLVVADSVDGGLGAAAEAHARWFAERGWAVGLASGGAKHQSIAPAEAFDLPLPNAAFDLRAVNRAAQSLRQLLRERRPAVVHVHGTRSQLVCLLAGCRPDVTMHGAGRVAGQGPVGTAVRRAARRVAPRLARTAYSASPAPGWRTLLHASPRLAGLDVTHLPAARTVPTFLWVGRLDVPKRPDVFVRACHEASRHRDLRGRVVGDGPLLEEARDLARRLGAPVEFLGERHDLAAQLLEAWALCLFSDFEGVPFAVQEAMWAGRAVVLSDLPGLRWFAGDSAQYVDGVAAAAEAIQRLCDHDVAQALGDEAAGRAHDLLTADAPFPQLLSDYRSGRR